VVYDLRLVDSAPRRREGSPGRRAPLADSWAPATGSRRRARTAIAVNLGLAVAALAAYLLLPVRADWGDSILLAALAAIAATAVFVEVRLKRGGLAFFDASLVLALLALVIGGPLPALAVWVVPEVVHRVVLRRSPVLSPGLVATVTSFGFAVLAGGGVLALAAGQSMLHAAPAIFCAGLAMWAANFAIARLAFAPFFQDFRPAALIRAEFLDLAPTVLGMLVVAVATAALVPVLGVFALALLASVLLLPQLGFERLARTRSVAALEHSEATRLYAAALADVLGMRRRERRLLDCAAQVLTGGEEGGELGLFAPRTPVGVSEPAYIALHATERWDGAGWPAGLPAEATPLPSRVVAVAEAWSALTACGTQELPHAEALLALAAQAGRQFDPRVVEAAAQVINEEEAFVREPSFEPKLHRLPLPRGVRRGALPALIPRISSSE
jgi:hypothetical protein